jgi:hypothetical protein
VQVICMGHVRFKDGVVEVVGRVLPDGNMEEMMTAQFNGPFDMALYRETVLQVQRFPALFPVA